MVVVEDRVAVVVEHGLLGQLDAGGPTSRSADIFAGDHQVGQDLFKPSTSGLEVVDLAASVVADDAVGVAQLDDRDYAERIGDLLDGVESLGGGAGLVGAQPHDPIWQVQHGLGGLVCVSQRLTAAVICRVPGSVSTATCFADSTVASGRPN